jgi:hypothetical protein
VVSNHFLGATPFLKVVCAVAIVFMSFALVGLAAGMGARHPRFGAENLTQVAGSYGGVAFMVLAVAYILAILVLLGVPARYHLLAAYRQVPLSSSGFLVMGVCFALAAALSLAVWLRSMRAGIRALEDLG